MSTFGRGRVDRHRSYHLGVLLATVLVACAGALADRAAAASPGELTPPDLRHPGRANSVSPTSPPPGDQWNPAAVELINSDR